MAIRYIIQSVPSSLQVLPDIISKTFPTEHWSTNAPVVYTRNILRLLDYVPQIQSDVLTLITSQLVKIDVHVQIDVEDLDDEMSESIVQEISKRDDDDFESGSESEVDDDDLDSEALRLKTVKTNIIRMDMIIDILFEYYAPVFSSQTTSAKDSALDLLLSQFHNIILPSSRSRHTQFLLFHFAQTSTLLIDRFASTCINIILNKNQPQLFRQSAAAYLGSFIARGNRVPSHVVRDVFELLAQQLNALRIEHDPTCRGPDLRRYSVFYSVAQAMIYMFCFRWRDLASSNPDDNASDDEDDPSDGEEDREITFSHTIKDPLRTAIYSKLNPLKICSPPIVTEFAKIANRLRFLYVYPLLETNKRLRLASVRSLTDMADRSSSRGGFSLPSDVTGGQNAWGGEESKWQLDAFFPFDPYHLPRSQRWVEGDYREWKGLDDDKEEEEEEDEESGDDSEAEKDVVGISALAAPKSISV
jgi:RNA polymerase I-specific transcription initiation factor RRN3